jgi:hypothetical protein
MPQSFGKFRWYRGRHDMTIHVAGAPDRQMWRTEQRHPAARPMKQSGQSGRADGVDSNRQQ